MKPHIITTLLPIILLMATPFPAFSKSQVYDGEYSVERVIRVIDGDTIRCDINGLPDIIGKNIAIRFAGIDTPELRDKNPKMKEKAYAVKAYVTERLNNANSISIRDLQRGSFFRIVARVIVDGKDLTQELLSLNYAVEFER